MHTQNAECGYFNSTNDGVFVRMPSPEFEDEEGAMQVCTPLFRLGPACDEDSTGWGYMVKVLSPDNCAHTVIIPASKMSSSRVVEYLRPYGFELIAPACVLFPLYWGSRPGFPRHRLVRRFGWFRNAFVLPSRVYGRTVGEELVPNPKLLPDHPFGQLGTLTQWQEHIGRYCVGNSRMILGVCAALAAPLLEHLGHESFGLHLYGPSSIAKTTNLRVAASVSGGGGRTGYLRSWRTTDSALEPTAATFNGSLLCLDELGQATPQVASEVAYMLANGRGRARASADGQRHTVLTWRLIFLSTGELSLADKISEGGHRTATLGQEVRVVDIPADAGAGLGLFEDIHRFSNASQFALHLQEAAAQYYGTPIRAFLTRLATDPEEAAVNVQRCLREIEQRYCAEGVGGPYRRIFQHFALLAVAGELGRHFEILPWPIEEALNGIFACFRECIAQRQGGGEAWEDALIARLYRFLRAQGDRFEDLSHRYRADIPRRAGYVRSRGGVTTYLIEPGVFEQEFCRGGDPQQILDGLRRAGILITDHGHFTKPMRYPGGIKRFYVIVVEGEAGPHPQQHELPGEPGA